MRDDLNENRNISDHLLFDWFALFCSGFATVINQGDENVSKQQQQHLKIQMRKYYDPYYIDKAKKSICKHCVNSQGFNGEFYDCSISDKVEVRYKRDGVFHTQLTACNGYKTTYGTKEIQQP